MGRESRGDRPTEEVLILAYGESGTAERGRNIQMRWRRWEMSGHELALGEMPLPVRPMQPLIGTKRARDAPGPSHSTNSPTTAPPPKKVRMGEMQIQTTETIETLDKKKLRAKLEEYKAMARERDERKKKFDELQVTSKEEEIKHLKELCLAKLGQISPEVLATMYSDGSKDASSRTKTQEPCIPREPVASPQTSQSASSHRNTIPDPSGTYRSPQFHESLNQPER